MRLATARDEIEPLRDPAVRQNEAYLTVLLLARTITRLGDLTADHARGDRGASSPWTSTTCSGSTNGSTPTASWSGTVSCPAVRPRVRGRPLRDRGRPPGGMTRPSPHELFAETARLAHHFHWPLDTILDLEHATGAASSSSPRRSAPRTDHLMPSTPSTPASRLLARSLRLPSRLLRAPSRRARGSRRSVAERRRPHVARIARRLSRAPGPGAGARPRARGHVRLRVALDVRRRPRRGHAADRQRGAAPRSRAPPGRRRSRTTARATAEAPTWPVGRAVVRSRSRARPSRSSAHDARRGSGSRARRPPLRPPPSPRRAGRAAPPPRAPPPRPDRTHAHGSCGRHGDAGSRAGGRRCRRAAPDRGVLHRRSPAPAPDMSPPSPTVARAPVRPVEARPARAATPAPARRAAATARRCAWQRPPAAPCPPARAGEPWRAAPPPRRASARPGILRRALSAASAAPTRRRAPEPSDAPAAPPPAPAAPEPSSTTAAATLARAA